MRRRRLLVAIALLVGIVFAVAAQHGSAGAAEWPGCGSFRTQAQAQAYWEQNGRAARADPDHDGRVCESLPVGAGDGPACRRTDSTVTVDVPRARYPEATLHFEVAWAQGVPRRYTIARDRTGPNRDAWEPLVPAGVDADGDGAPDDRDEVPMAMTLEGGATAPNGRSASHIAYVDTKDNQGAGSFIGHRLRPYCNGQRFRIRPTGRRTRTAVIVIALRNGEPVVPPEIVRRR